MWMILYAASNIKQKRNSSMMEFGRFEEEESRKRGKKPDTFNFRGFMHYCSKSRDGKCTVMRKTSRKKFAKKCKNSQVHWHVVPNENEGPHNEAKADTCWLLNFSV